MKPKTPEWVYCGAFFLILGIYQLYWVIYVATRGLWWFPGIATAIFQIALGTFFVYVGIIGAEAFWKKLDKKSITEEDAKRILEEYEHG